MNEQSLGVFQGDLVGAIGDEQQPLGHAALRQGLLGGHDQGIEGIGELGKGLFHHLAQRVLVDRGGLERGGQPGRQLGQEGNAQLSAGLVGDRCHQLVDRVIRADMLGEPLLKRLELGRGDVQPLVLQLPDHRHGHGHQHVCILQVVDVDLTAHIEQDGPQAFALPQGIVEAQQFGGLAAADGAEQQHMPLLGWEEEVQLQIETELARQIPLGADPAACLVGIDKARVVRAERLVQVEFLQHFQRVAGRTVGHRGSPEGTSTVDRTGKE